MTLYELTNEYKRLYDMAEEMDLSPYDLKDTLDGMDEQLSEKADGYGKVIRQMESDSDAIDAEIKRLQGRKKTIKSNINRMKSFLKIAMDEAGKKEICGELFKFKIRKNPPKLEIPNESLVPKEFRIPQPDKIDKRAIMNEIRASGPVDWAEIVREESLQMG